VLSLPSAAKLLQTCDSVTAANPLALALGFDGGLVPLTAAHVRRLGLPTAIAHARLAQGDGALRLFAFETRERGCVRRELDEAAQRLARDARLLWLVLAIDREGGETALGIADSTRDRSRTSALVVCRASVVDSDSETVCALAAGHTRSDILTHCRWQEILGRESVGRRFFRVLEQKVRQMADSLDPAGPPQDADELALLFVSRLLFLSFLETKGWLNRDHGFLETHFAECMMRGGRFHERVLAPLFFGTLNTAPAKRARRARAFGRVPFLNGGLFSRSPVERRNSGRRFSDEALGDLFGDLLLRYRFTAREDTSTWSEAAIDPEMLGRAFEGLMASSDRRRSGAFYTPQSLVTAVTRSALVHTLASPSLPARMVEALLDGSEIDAGYREKTLRASESLRILDPACGSGAFLVYALEEVSRIRQQCGDVHPLHRIRRRVLTSSIFGVDINTTAVWLCELRLWLSMAIEDPEPDPMAVTPLPNLDRNIRVGDSLSGGGFAYARMTADSRAVANLRARYSRATGPRKRSLGRLLDRTERDQHMMVAARNLASLREQRRELVSLARTRNLFGERPPPPRSTKVKLAEVREQIGRTRDEIRRLESGGALPFAFASGFADVAAAGGFDIVVGNPPWVRTHNLDPVSKPALRRTFQVYRDAAWRGGCEASAAGRGFASQVDLAALFIERSVKLLRSRGVVALVVPSKLWRSLAGGGLRQFLAENARLREVHDLTSASTVFDAAVYPSVVVAERSSDGQRDTIAVVVHRGGTTETCRIAAQELAFDSSRGSPWLLVPRGVRTAFDCIAQAGTPLGQTRLGRPLLGVKTGCNAAFLQADAGVESQMLRNVIRGEDLKEWRVESGLRILWTHDASGKPVSQLPPLELQHLRRWRGALESRTDAQSRGPWWRLFRTESASYDLPRVVWADIGKRPTAAILPAGDQSVPLNTCYALRCPTIADAHAVAAIINSDVAAAWLDLIAEPARGGYRRYMGWTMALLPLPRDWDRARALLSPVGLSASLGEPPQAEYLRAVVLESYGIDEQSVAPLLLWSKRT
jgi:hypothetical protein